MLTRREFIRFGGLGLAAAACRLAPTEVPAAENVGWDHDVLAELLGFAAASSTDSLLVAEGRETVLTWNRDSDARSRDVASVQKSITSLLVGSVLADGLLDLDEPVSTYLGEGWSNARSEAEVTTRHLLTMTSGLNRQLRTVADPGGRWDYNTVAYHQLHWVLERVTGRSLQDLSSERLFGPLSADLATWQPRGLSGQQTDPKGNPMMGLIMSASDLAHVGNLVLEGGARDGKQLVPTAYLEEATSPSQRLNPSYGFLWWLNGQSGHRLPTGSALRAGPLLPDAPPDVIAALGAGDQKLYIWPARQVVIVRLGEATGPNFDAELWRLVLRAAPGAHSG